MPDYLLIALSMIGSLVFLFLFIIMLRKSVKVYSERNLKILSKAKIIIYGIACFALLFVVEIRDKYNLSDLMMKISILSILIILMILIVHNIVMGGFAGIFVSFIQLLIGVILASSVYMLIVGIIMIIAIGIGGGSSDPGGDRKILRSVDDGTTIYVHEWGDGCWKDDSGNCYYNDSGDRWYDDSLRYYIEI